MTPTGQPTPLVAVVGHETHTHPADKYAGDSDQQLSSMTSDELRESEQYWAWEGERTTNPYSRWWCSKAQSRATREFDQRGIENAGRR